LAGFADIDSAHTNSVQHGGLLVQLPRARPDDATSRDGPPARALHVSRRAGEELHRNANAGLVPIVGSTVPWSAVTYRRQCLADPRG
jgi:hypothetical protein